MIPCQYGALALVLALAGFGTALTAQTLPTLGEAFGRPIPGVGGVAGGSDLMRLEVPGDIYPQAHCADGTPAVYYVRRAATAEHRDRWVIYLQGGGSCASGQNCHDRWLGRDGNFGGNKLSSRFAPVRGIAGQGIESTSGRNPFASWNHVFVYYCSSDGWIGQRAGVATSALHRGVDTAYQIDFLGANIVDAVIEQLRGSSGKLSYRTARGDVQSMPDLDEATHVLFSGSSAGGGGVRSNADAVHERLRAHNVRCTPQSCPLTFAAVIDASYGLAHATLDHSDSLLCGPDLVGNCSYEWVMRRRWTEAVQGFWGGRLDASCLAYHQATDDQWRCADGAHQLEHHLNAPIFVRADLQDKLIMRNTIDAGFRYDGVPIDRTLYGLLEEIQLHQLATLGERSEEPRSAGPLEPPGVFGPQCGDHEALRTNVATFRRRIDSDDETSHTTLQVLHNWLTGRPRSAVIESFDPAGPPDSCGG